MATDADRTAASRSDGGWHDRVRPSNRPGESVLLLLFLAASAVWRVFLLRRETINPDEVFLIGGAFRVREGMLPFLDYIEVHAPLLFKLYSPLLGWVGETPRFLDAFRWLHCGLSLALMVLLFLLARRLFGPRAALWSVFLLHTFQFFVERTVHVRPDTPALVVFLAALCLLAPPHRPGTRGWRVAGAGFLLSLAFSLHVTTLFSALAVMLWLPVARPGEVRNPAAWGAALLAGGVFLLSYGLLSALLYGSRAAEALTRHLDLFALDAVYQGAFHPDTVGIFFTVLLRSAPAWVLLGWALPASNLRWMRGRLPDAGARLFVLLADMGVLFLLARDSNFEQHYLPVAVFGSVPAAVLLLEWGRRAAVRLGENRVGHLGLLVAVLLAAWTVVASWQALDESRARQSRLVPQPEEALRAMGEKGRAIAGADVREWLRKRPLLQDPFLVRPKRHREAQVRFLLEHSRPGEVVFSDWLNPPYRNLPAPYHHGFMISLFYGSERLREAPGLVGLVRRYDPSYSAADSGEAGHMIRLFEAVPPRVILLEGSAGRLFATSDLFYDWVAARYGFELEPESGTVFAVTTGAILWRSWRPVNPGCAPCATPQGVPKG